MTPHEDGLIATCTIFLWASVVLLLRIYVAFNAALT